MAAATSNAYIIYTFYVRNERTIRHFCRMEIKNLIYIPIIVDVCNCEIQFLVLRRLCCRLFAQALGSGCLTVLHFTALNNKFRRSCVIRVARTEN